ncbi:hypothetical protein BDA99DRAFT_168256 [Phascolomyces articulosus]|uniref:F-box domain-containing protein n=1 Tax=Phascolomyces articulosus TaxID=60185 RepID=A0AAD5K442_9FUNG|nr:hypothetical protein BDA99DRAFT_168256 [Phascolomyces articulosus]
MSKKSANALITSISKVEKALETSDFDVVIEETTSGLNELHGIHLQLLSARITAYEQNNKLSQAYNDAIIMTKLFPNSALGYIHLGNILMKRRKSKEAYAKCNEALNEELVAPSDPHYQALVNLRQDIAYQRQKKSRVDFIKLFPKEVISLIFEQLSMGDNMTCLDVSKTWRQALLNCPGALRSCLLGPFKAEQDLRAGYENIRLVCDYIWELHIFSLEPDEESLNVVSELLDEVKFRQLREFSLYISSIEEKQILDILENSRDSLEELYFTFSSTNVRFEDIITTCKNIKKLTYDVLAPLGYRSKTPLPPQLTHLKIYAQDVRQDEVQKILENAPNLQEITIGYCDAIVLHTFYKYGGKNLYHIDLNPDRFMPGDVMIRTSSNCFRKSKALSKGHSSKMIGVYFCEDVTAELLLPLLVKHQNTTKAITVSVTQEGNDGIRSWRAFANYSSPHIQYMKLGFTQETEYIFASLIRKCSVLEAIEFHETSPTSPTFNALRSLSKEGRGLRCFIIANDEQGPKPRIVDGDLRSFFEYYASLGETSTLEEVGLRYFPGIQAATLRILSKINSLKTVDLAGELIENVEVMDSAVRLLTAASSSLPLLEHICFEGIPITDDGIELLDCKNIKLISLDDITMAGVEMLIENSKMLKTLEVSECQEVEYETLCSLTKNNDITLIYAG